MKHLVSARLAAIVLTAMVAWVLPALPACAHASLISTEPQDGSLVGSAPSSYSLTFNEPVSPLSLTLLKPDGTSLVLDRFELHDTTLAISAPSGLGSGTHVLSWRVISEDGHPVSGSVVFSIREVSVTQPQPEPAIDWTVRAGLWVGKVALYVGLFIGAGGAFALGWLLNGARDGRKAVVAALAIGVFGALVSAGFQGLDVLGAQSGRIVDPIVWTAGIGTSLGGTLAAAIGAIVVAGLSLSMAGTPSRLLSVAGLLLVGGALAVSGHASAANPQWLMRSAVFLHGLAVASWAGALIPLGLALAGGVPQAVPALRRFSRAIPYVLAVLIAAGLVLATVQVERPRALIDTAYGQVFLVKLGLLVLLFALASLNRWRLTHPVESGSGLAARRLARSIAAETAIVLVIFAVVACWRFTPPPRALALAAAQPAYTHIHTAKAMADVTMTPGHTGPVDVSVFVVTGDFNPLDAKEITVVLSKPTSSVEPIRRTASKQADGTWQVEKLVLPVAGAWKVRLDILISDFEMVQLEGEINVKP